MVAEGGNFAKRERKDSGYGSNGGKSGMLSGDTANHPIIAARKGSKVRNKALGIRLPLLGYPAISHSMSASPTPDRTNTNNQGF